MQRAVATRSSMNDRIIGADPTEHWTPPSHETLAAISQQRGGGTTAECPETDTAIGSRDRAMLQILCFRPARQRAIPLQVTKVNLRLGIVNCIGKGTKERITPIGSEARDRINTDVRNFRRKFLDRKKVTDPSKHARGRV